MYMHSMSCSEKNNYEDSCNNIYTQISDMYQICIQDPYLIVQYYYAIEAISLIEPLSIYMNLAQTKPTKFKHPNDNLIEIKYYCIQAGIN